MFPLMSWLLFLCSKFLHQKTVFFPSLKIFGSCQRPWESWQQSSSLVLTLSGTSKCLVDPLLVQIMPKRQETALEGCCEAVCRARGLPGSFLLPL